MPARNQVRIVFVAAAVLTTLGSAVVRASIIPPLLDYTFNDTGTTSANSGSVTGQNVTLENSLGTATNLHTAAGTGPSGLPGDTSFDGSAATGMGTASGTANLAISGSTPLSIGSLTSLTFTTWFKTSSTNQIANKARLLDLGNITIGGGDLPAGGNPGNVSFEVNGATTVDSTGAAYSATQSWVFLAITADFTQTSNNIKFYIGTPTSAVSLVSTASISATAANAPSNAVWIGNRSSFDRPFQGFLDDLRLFGTTSGNSAAFAQTDLETIRQTDLTNTDVVPEPGSVGILVASALGLLARRKRDR